MDELDGFEVVVYELNGGEGWDVMCEHSISPPLSGYNRVECPADTQGRSVQVTVPEEFGATLTLCEVTVIGCE